MSKDKLKNMITKSVLTIDYDKDTDTIGYSISNEPEIPNEAIIEHKDKDGKLSSIEINKEFLKSNSTLTLMSIAINSVKSAIQKSANERK